MSQTKTVLLSPRQQLIDLNGDTTNFNLTFTAKCKDNSSFDALVVDQKTLDNNPNLEFKKAEGTISGNIISDKNIYQNYFLCLKSEKPCTVEITIDKKEIAPSVNSQYSMLTKNSGSGVNWKLIFVVIAIIAVGVVIYHMYSKRKETYADDDNFSVSGKTISPSPSPDRNPINFGKEYYYQE